jgi:acetyl-CoA acetyltransferase
MPDPVYILGGAQTDFARNWHREGLGIDSMMGEVLAEGLAATELEARDIRAAHVGNFVAELVCHQGQLGGKEGVIAFDGRLPINPSGGLIGLGHPVGATGVRMMLDGWRQVTGRAGAYQVEGARRVGLLNIGGSTTTIVSFVVGAGA